MVKWKSIVRSISRGLSQVLSKIMYVKFLPKYLVENKYSMLDIIIIIITVLNISTKITCGGCLFYMHIVP